MHATVCYRTKLHNVITASAWRGTGLCDFGYVNLKYKLYKFSGENVVPKKWKQQFDCHILRLFREIRNCFTHELFVYLLCTQYMYVYMYRLSVFSLMKRFYGSPGGGQPYTWQVHCVCRKVVKDIYIEILLFAYAKGNHWSELLSCTPWLPGSRY